MPLATCVLLPLTLACPSKERPAPPPAPRQTLQSHGLRVTVDPTLFGAFQVRTEPKLTAQEVGDNLPEGEGPERVGFTFTTPAPPFGDHPPKARSSGRAMVTFLPRQDPSVPDFAAAYPLLTRDIDTLQRMLATRPGRAPEGRSLPDTFLVDAAHSVEARLTYLDLPWVRGILYLTSYEQDFNPIDNQVLEAVFQGLSTDGRYVVAARFQLAHPQLPTVGKIQSPEPSAEAQARDRKAISTLLTNAKDDTFYPSLTSVKALLGSLGPAR